MRTRENFDNLHPDTPITRADVAFLAGVEEQTVQAWTQTPRLNFPESHRFGGRQMVWHKLGEVIDWLCKTGRAECGLEEGKMTLDDIAEHFDVKPVTVKMWRSRGIFPDPDLVLGRSPLWDRETVTSWKRPGRKGGHTTRPREFDPDRPPRKATTTATKSSAKPKAPAKKATRRPARSTRKATR